MLLPMTAHFTSGEEEIERAREKSIEEKKDMVRKRNGEFNKTQTQNE